MKLYQRGRIWWVFQGQGKSNKSFRISTHETDKAKAMEIALKLIAPVITDSKAELLEKAAALKKSAAESMAGNHRLVDIFTPGKYSTLHACKLSNALIASKYWHRFLKYCESSRIVYIDELTCDICNGFLQELKDRSSQLARCYCSRIIKDAGCTRELFSAQKRRHHATHREPLTMDQIGALMQELARMMDIKYPQRRSYNEEFYYYVRTLLYTGLRMGDAVTLKTAQYDSKTNIIYRVMDKTSIRIEFPLHSTLQEFFVRQVAAGQQYIFPGLAGIYSKNPGVITKRIKRLLERCGIEGEQQQYCAHCFRTTFASLCAESGIPLAVIQSWLGHTSPMITRIYARIEDIRQKRIALEKFPDLG